MEKYLPLIQHSVFFNGFTLEETQTALNCLQGQTILYAKKDTLFYPDTVFHSIGILLEGSVYLSKTNIHGERQIFAELSAGELFGENCLWEKNTINKFEVEAAASCIVLYIERDKILHPEKTTCPLRQRIIENLFQLLLSNNQSLYQKIDLASQKNLREQLLYYLQLQSRKNNSSQFDISFSRQELADYLGVDRSALSRELGRMKTDGLIDYKKNSFTLISQN
ncbi:Crp/Fnr family transcriptional regulator [Enterococcus sp. BWB1-3]|uniref:Crp/Fnr family transcriptional regulator n=1 Tax=unclassified Enterococcus TaxID=2608891 RepID=UPI001923C6B4|nr:MULTISPECIES: Crp/Fnr family transcriptional regulator [unclassified Enterococcus]MBL1229261.1 Crp/Fnr family transcriptional regulator [Enterococcus sp. BWB1-3]MCB5951751.1 Crp/Fnr family transcriptional regulator [Enterococcus sp. BWT-B8]MCB5953918.1 Crp/Fnr family transcriptional regulator [Enterococcus sp. CWB-B31]